MNGLKNYLITNGKTHSWLELANMFNILPEGNNKQKSDKVRKFYKRFIDSQKTIQKEILYSTKKSLDTEYQEFLAWKKAKEKPLPTPYINGNPNNVLIIGDLHEPFCLEDYLYFCREQQERFDCGKIIFIGDVIDNHFSSFHDADADGYSAGMELEQAILKLQKWYSVFPEAIVTVGNHDRIIARKIYSGQLSQRWLKPIQEVLLVPNWKFVDEYIYNDVLYIHGEGGTAKTKSMQEGISTVQGHLHTEGYVDWMYGSGKNRFAMQVGCGIDFEQYAFSYAQRGKKPVISCGVVLNNNFPILIPHGS